MTYASSFLDKKLRDFLPDIYQKDPKIRGDDFLDRFLNVFQNILVEMPWPLDPPPDPSLPDEGLDQIISRIHEFFGPFTAPANILRSRDFLDYLAEWAGIIQRYVIAEYAKRRMLAQIIPLYKWRGTKRGLKGILEAMIGPDTVSIHDQTDEITQYIDGAGYLVEREIAFLQHSNFVFAVEADLSQGCHIIGTFSDNFPTFFTGFLRREKPAQTALLLDIFNPITSGGTNNRNNHFLRIIVE